MKKKPTQLIIIKFLFSLFEVWNTFKLGVEDKTEQFHWTQSPLYLNHSLLLTPDGPHIVITSYSSYCMTTCAMDCKA